MKQNNIPGSTLICTLGTSAPVISETLTALKARNILINKLIIIHTNDPRVFTNKIAGNLHDIGLNALLAHLKKTYQKLIVKLVDLGKSDITSEEDNNKLLNITLKVIAEEKKHGRKIYLGIAGGRKTMSAIALFAGYLIGCNGIYHIIVNGDERELNKKYHFDIPNNCLTLIDIPNINLSTVLSTVISDIDNESKYKGNFYNFLSDNSAAIDDVFKRVNDKLKSNLNTKKLKEEYEAKAEQYLKFCNLVKSILLNRAKGLALLTPQIDLRVKSFESIIGKIERRHIAGKPGINPFTDFDDIAGVRVICYFSEDVAALKKYFNAQQDFNVESYENKYEEFGYTAYHFNITLKPERTKLIEYSDLAGLKCEVQIKTVFAHSWSVLEHRLMYKSPEFRNMKKDQQKKVNEVFTSSAVLLKQTEKVVSRLRKYYKT